MIVVLIFNNRVLVNFDGSHICGTDWSHREESVGPSADVNNPLVQIEQLRNKTRNFGTYTQKESWKREQFI